MHWSIWLCSITWHFRTIDYCISWFCGLTRLRVVLAVVPHEAALSQGGCSYQNVRHPRWFERWLPNLYFTSLVQKKVSKIHVSFKNLQLLIFRKVLFSRQTMGEKIEIQRWSCLLAPNNMAVRKVETTKHCYIPDSVLFSLQHDPPLILSDCGSSLKMLTPKLAFQDNWPLYSPP